MPYMKTFLQLAYLACMYPVIESWTDVTTLQNMCPYTQFCSGGPKISSSSSKSCCLPCSCSDNCVKLGNCCPDKHGGVSVPPIYPCKFQGDLYNEAMGYDMSTARDIDFNVKFRVINACPISQYYSNSNLVLQTIQNCHEPLELQDLAFVSNANGEEIYFNKHCAKCNGVEDVISWTLLVYCPLFLQQRFSSLDEWKEFAFHNCTMMSKPPENVNYMSSICYPNQIGVCNETGLWNFKDPDLERACRLHGFPYLGDPRLKYQYSNVFCYLCNAPKGTTANKECSEVKVFIEVRAVTYPLTILLKLTGDDGDEAISTQLERSSKCAPNEVEDLVTLQCKQLICPIGYIPMRGQCHKIVNSIDGLCFDINFQFTLTDSQMSIIKKDSALLQNDIIRSVESTLEANNAYSCRVNKCTLLQKPSNKIFVLAGVHSTEECEYLSLIQGLVEFIKTGTVKVVLEGQKVTLPLMEFEYSIDVYNDVLWYSEKQSYECETKMAISNDTIACPSIEISPKELHNANITEELVETILAVSVPTIEDLYRICLDKYKSLMSEKSTASMFDNKSNVLFVYIYLFGVILPVQ